MIKIDRGIIIALSLSILIGGMFGCKRNEGPMERSGREIDKAVEKTGQQIKKAVEKTGEKLEKAGEKVKESVK
ncbi:MAG: hypothetical protein PHI31_11290 [Desulfuromonadaceae bacterium]|nr:hypothetical protein [Desulfuromonadaceae bacterium]